MLSVTDFDPKETSSEVRVHVGLYLDILDADQSPNADRAHAGTSQVDFKADFPPPAACTKRSFDHHGKGNGKFVLKKRVSKNEKKVVSLIDLKEMKTRNDCEIACDCVKRANVVLHVGLCEEIFARKHTSTHKPTSAQPLSALIMTSRTHI